MLIAQCDSRLVCSEVKLALLESLPADHQVTVLQRLGLPDERVFTVDLEDVDREVEPDHLTSLFVDTGNAAVGPELARLLALTERLRGPAAAVPLAREYLERFPQGAYAQSARALVERR